MNFSNSISLKFLFSVHAHTHACKIYAHNEKRFNWNFQSWLTPELLKLTWKKYGWCFITVMGHYNRNRATLCIMVWESELYVTLYSTLLSQQHKQVLKFLFQIKPRDFNQMTIESFCGLKRSILYGELKFNERLWSHIFLVS